MPALALILQALPALAQTGFSLYELVTHANEKVPVVTPADAYASQILMALPGLIRDGFDIKDLVTESAARVSVMLKEDRGPTEAEKAEQAARLAGLDADYDKAAGSVI